MKNLFYLIIITLILSSCGRSKTFYVKNNVEITEADYNAAQVQQMSHPLFFHDSLNSFTAEPYGWADSKKLYNPNVTYEVSVGNVVWSVILSETIIMPIWLTGWRIKVPVKYKPSKK